MNAIPTIIPKKAEHRPLLLSPYYARTSRDDRQPQLHEYRDPDFMTLFAEDLLGNRLRASGDQSWYRANKLDGKAWPQLRQPMHQGYYIATSEVTCDNKSRAAIKPGRIKEAWILVTPHGQGLYTAGRNPRQINMLLQARLAQAKQDGTAFPARPEVATGEQGRKHTVLAGYLPIADIVNKESQEELQSEQQTSQSAAALAEKFAANDYAADDEVLWDGAALVARPGAAATQPSRLSALLQLLDENLGLGIAGASLVDAAGVDGNQDQAQIHALSNWLNSVWFHVLPGDARSSALNDQQQNLRTQLSRLNSNLNSPVPGALTQAVHDAIGVLRQALQSTALPQNTPRRLDFDRIHHYSPERIAEFTAPWKGYVSALKGLAQALRVELDKLSNVLLAQLSQLSSALDDFLGALQTAKSAANALDQQFQPRHKYRGLSLRQWYLSAREDQDLELKEQLPEQQKLIVPGAWVAQGPALITDRWRSLIDTFVAEWQASQQASLLTQDDEQLYQITMLAMVAGDDGCEYLAHSSPSEPFAIASHYETRLMPSYPIKMPTLKDLKKAIRGPAMIMPSDLADQVNQLRFPDGEVKKGGASGGGIRWIYVFSIPIVTICAMILLMLMINILNFIFRWIPFAILRIPFPK